MAKKKEKVAEPVRQEPKQQVALSTIMPLESGGTGKMQVSKAGSNIRRNVAADIERTNNYANIWSGLSPFQRVHGTNISPRDAVELCQLAYYNFPMFTNTVNFMTEFSISEIRFKGGSAKSRTFFKALFNKISMWTLLDMFFREYYRSGNVFIYRFETTVQPEDIKNLTQTFGANLSDVNSQVKLPVKYIILNPCDIEAGGNVSFVSAQYFKIFNQYELLRLRNPSSPEDRELLDSLPPETQNLINKVGASYVMMPLSPAKVAAVFKNRQSYEPFAVPMGFGVLADINFKAEMRKMDMAVTRTVQQAILLVTMGAKPDDGGTNPKALEAMQNIFNNLSCGRVIVADFTTKAEFIMPDVAAFLDPKKYESIERDIRMGLNNILVEGDEKFANSSMKVQIIIERLKQGREAFLSEFLIPEIRRIAEMLGLQNFPTPYFADINLKDGLEYAKLYTHLGEIGLLTAEEVFEAINTGLLPDAESSLASQTEFEANKIKGLYQPLMGGPADNLKLAKVKATAPPMGGISKPAGRPTGTKAPQTKKKMTPIGGEQTYSAAKITENILLVSKLEKEIKKQLLSKFKVKELGEDKALVVGSLVDIIISNEEPQNWLAKIPDYIKNPVGTNEERVGQVQDVAAEHGLDNYLASILLASKIEPCPSNETE